MPQKLSSISSFRVMFSHAIGIAVILVLACLWRYAFVNSNVGIAKRNLILNGKVDCETMVLGNSHANAVDMDQLGRAGCYLNMSGTMAIEASITLEKTVLFGLSPKLVLLGISPGFFSADGKQLTIRRARTYWVWGITQSAAFYDIYGILEAFFLPVSSFRETVLSYFLKPDSGSEVMDERGKTHYKNNTISENNWSTLAKQRVDFQIRELGIDKTEICIGRLGFERLQALLSDLAAKGTRVVLFTPSYSRDYLDALPKGLLDDTAKQAQRLSDLIPGAVYANHAVSEISDMREMFHDPDHLNQLGQELYSRECLRPLIESLDGAAEPNRP